MDEWRDFIRCEANEKSIAAARAVLRQRPIALGRVPVPGLEPVFVAVSLTDVDALVTIEWVFEAQWAVQWKALPADAWRAFNEFVRKRQMEDAGNSSDTS